MRVVFLCGGSGTRLWPESRESLPKQFIPLIEGISLLELTIKRVLKIISKNKPIFICNKRHGFLVKKLIQKYEFEADIILEPEGKNTCAAIYLAAKHSNQLDNLLILPSDHYILKDKEFCKDMKKIDKQLSPNHWITLGVKPTKASEAYGYIKIIKDTVLGPYKVLKFIEKPKKDLANKFVSDESYYWNSGIFFANTEKILSSIKNHAPKIAVKCDLAYENITLTDNSREINFDSNLFSKIPSESIDYSVMEKEKEIYLYPFHYEWNDVGSWDSLSKIYYEKSSDHKVIQVDSYNNFIRNNDRTIATIGIKDLIIVNSDNATLISKKEHSEKVKLVVEKLLNHKSNVVTEHSFENRPWGKFENLLHDGNCKVKRLIVNPKKRLSLQYHEFRSEHWLIVSGTASIHLNGKDLTLTKGQSVDIPKKSRHFIENKTSEDLIIIETQLGTYFGEDDIIRLDDPYNR